MRRSFVRLSAVLALSWAVPAAASEGRRLHLACARGAAPVCRTLLANPKLAPGVRVAIEQQLAEIEATLARCEAGEREPCRTAIVRFPELPPPVLEAARERAGR